MDFIEKCKAAGIGDGSAYDGYPVVNGKVLKRVDGDLKAFTRHEDCRPWEAFLIEDKDFDTAILTKIAAIEEDRFDQLSQAEQDAIAASEAAEAQKAAAPTPVELDTRLKALEAAIAT